MVPASMTAQISSADELCCALNKKNRFAAYLHLTRNLPFPNTYKVSVYINKGNGNNNQFLETEKCTWLQ
jgi:hypothetical protein